MREIKFRAWINGGPLHDYAHVMIYDLAFEEYAPINDLLNGVSRYGELMQCTGLKDKKKPKHNDIYEGDIVSLDGIVIGNIYEMEPKENDLVIKGFGTGTWRITEKKAMDRGCSYAE